MGFLMPCCMCGAMLTSRVQKSAFRITRQVKFNHKGEVTLDQELGSARPVCDSCVSRMEGQGHVFLRDGTVVKHYAEDGTSALVPTPNLPLPPSTKAVSIAASGATTSEVRRGGYKDVQIEYLLKGISGVNAMVEEKRVSKKHVKMALKALQTSGRDVTSLEKWVRENVGPIGSGRGSPVKGESRNYRAQQLRNSGPFIRLPVDSLSARKGHLINVFFEGDSIVVKAIPR